MERARENLSVLLRRTRDVLEPLRGRTPAVPRALDLLERDLLPRTAGGDDYLVAGIIGPNNAGKSALFNALVGRDLSPSLPAGGATRRLVGAAHPSLIARLTAEPTLARFRTRQVDPARPCEQALETADDPAELLLSPEPDMPPGLMLIDTPDFDSILGENRIVSESLLAVADLVVAVVTRHSYQNREVVRFLNQWLAHGRPWMLVYNEATDAGVAAAHTTKLAADVAARPLEVFWSPHDLAIQRHATPLDPKRLGRAGEPEAAQPSLAAHLFDEQRIGEVKRRAFDAALGRLGDAVDEIAAELEASAARARAVLAAADRRAHDAGVRIASRAMPARPFVEAFRAVLDRRSNPLSRSWRASLRRVRVGLEAIPALLFGGARRVEDGESAQSLTAIERKELGEVWPTFWEELARDLGPEARDQARRRADATLAALLDAELADQRRDGARGRIEERLGAEPADVGDFRVACEALVDGAIEERGFDLDIQLAADIATLMPIALAAAVIVHTAGIGSDIAAAGGGALSSFLIEKYSHLLGAGVLSKARRRWTEIRGRQLADLLVEASLPEAVERLRSAAGDDARHAQELAELAAAFTVWTGHGDSRP